jgi:CHASE2 domain-containing sensor protein
VEWWLVLLASALLVGGSVASGLTDRFDLLLYDLAQRQLPRQPAQDILLVAIDDRSLGEIGPWPWPRATQARLLGAVAQGKPRAVALDVLLPEAGGAAGDKALAAAMRGGAPVFLPVQFAVPGRDGAAFNLVEPQPAFRAAAAGLGHVNLAPDADGVMRRVYLDYGAGAQSWPHLASLMAERAGKALAPLPPFSSLPSSSSALVGRRPALIAFTGPQGSFPSISAASVLRGELPPEVMAGR